MKNMIFETMINLETGRLAIKKGFINYASILDKWLRIKQVIVSQSILQKWLREEHNIHVLPYIMTVIDSKDYAVSILQPKPAGQIGVNELLGVSSFKTYEDALERGLQEALTFLELWQG